MRLCSKLWCEYIKEMAQGSLLQMTLCRSISIEALPTEQDGDVGNPDDYKTSLSDQSCFLGPIQVVWYWVIEQ